MAEPWQEKTVDESGEPRLDVFVAREFPGVSRSAAQRLIDENRVRVNGSAARASLKLQPGDRVEVSVPAPRPTELRAQEIPLEVIYQDDQLAVIEKPAGLVVHPAKGHEDGTLVNALLHHLKDLSSGSGVGGELRPGIVHRIDRQTSGLLLVTKTDLAHQHLSAQFKEHSISRRYLGLCWGELPASGEWDAAIARDPKERKRMALVPDGRRAVTRYRALDRFGAALTFFEAELLTGRTHQVRVHFAAHGFPLAGDATYAGAYRAGRKKQDAGENWLRRRSPETAATIAALDQVGRQFLHAAHLGFEHPVTGKRLQFDSPLPPPLDGIMVGLRSCCSPER